MFQVKNFKIENLAKPLVDIDIAQSGDEIFLSGYLESQNFVHRRTRFATHIHFDNEIYCLPETIRNPNVKSINRKTALVTGLSKNFHDNHPINAWIIDSSGKVKTEFSTEWGVTNISITKDFIVIGYIDQTACNGEGLEIYDFEGKLLFGYEELFGEDSVEVFDCYATAFVEENQVIFFPYTEFPLVLFDIDNRTQQIWKTPKEVAGSKAITKNNNHIFFHSPYNDRFGIYKWEIENDKAEKIGEYKGQITHGLPNGEFFAKNDLGYSIISLN